MVWVFGVRVIVGDENFGGVRWIIRNKLGKLVEYVFKAIDEYGDVLCPLIREGVIVCNIWDNGDGDAKIRIENCRYYLIYGGMPCCDEVFARCVSGCFEAIRWYLDDLKNKVDIECIRIFNQIADKYSYDMAIDWYRRKVRKTDNGMYRISKNNEKYKGDTGILSVDGDIEVSDSEEFRNLLSLMY